jgi:hypothetical protein
VISTVNGNARDRVEHTQAQVGHGQRDGQDDDRKGARRKDSQPESVAATEYVAGQRVSGRGPDHERQDERYECHDHASPERRLDARRVDEEVDRVERDLGRDHLAGVVKRAFARRDRAHEDEVDRDQNEQRHERRGGVRDRPA